MLDPGAGGGLLDGRVLAALALLLLNDHVLKVAARGTDFAVVTGKLSDVAGLIFLPVLLVAGTELLRRARGSYDGPVVHQAVVVAVTVAVAFTLMKTSAIVGDVYATTLGLLQWPFFAVAAAVEGRTLPPVRAVAHVVDPTDVVAVVGAAFVVWQTRRRRDLAPPETAGATLKT